MLMKLLPRFPHFLHGGDYNPDQWLDHPEILDEDVRLMQKAHVNAVSIGIFSWSRLEPEDGVYDFQWLDQVIDRLWAKGIHVVLATPSGARPAWMAEKYPEVLRVDERFQRRHFGERHNHCPSSPVFREKVRKIDTLLARRYASHPSVILWHISNEFSGECRCALCTERFRHWLKEKYQTLDALNQAWYTDFWSMRYSAWSQIEPPSPVGQNSNLSLLLDWRRFSTWMCKDFIELEKKAVREANPELPCTANLMERFWDYDYFSLSESIDVVSWDCYPLWTGRDDDATACEYAMNHEMMRSLKDQPFLLMESSPSNVNWKPVNKLKKPGMHLLSSMQAVAHGSNSVQYFQWRQGRGNAEMFHGAVVSHSGRDDTRVFRDVTQVGQVLESLDSRLYDTPVASPEVCILYDWESRWAVEYAQTGLQHGMRYHETALEHYHALWAQGLNVDFRDMRECTDLSRYRLVIAPQLFLFRNQIEEKLRRYVASGGTLVMTYFSGIVDDHDQAFLSDCPHGLTDVLGVRETEMDALFPDESNAAVSRDGSVYPVSGICSILETEGAEVVAAYRDDFYQGTPVITHHAFGDGNAWYLGARLTQDALDAFYARLSKDMNLSRPLPCALPHGVTAHKRGDVIFLENYSGTNQSLPELRGWQDMLENKPFDGYLCAWTVRILIPSENR